MGGPLKIRQYLTHPYLGGRVFDFQKFEDGGSVVGDGDITDVVDQHLVETDGSERRLDDVGDGLRRQNVLRSNVATGATLALDAQHVCDRRHSDQVSVKTIFILFFNKLTGIRSQMRRFQSYSKEGKVFFLC